ncbi:hypothetical protein EJB05_12565, partial [Eragrostis curvula]
MESLWDRLPRGIVKELTRGGFKCGDALPQDLVDHFEELDRLTGRNSLVEVPAQPVPLVVVPPVSSGDGLMSSYALSSIDVLPLEWHTCYVFDIKSLLLKRILTQQ